MSSALQVAGLNKKFKDFELKNISFKVPEGSVVGLVGENGSGKSTLIRCILNQDVYESGTIEIYGENPRKNVGVHNHFSAASDWSPFSQTLTPHQISSFLKDIYENWDETQYFAYLEHFGLPLNKRLATFSRGMKVKLSFCVALSHHADLLILDEATSGLDPIVREEILELLLDFMQEEQRSIFLTSHITSDIERIADYILYIDNGEIRFMIEKEKIENWGLANVRQDQLEVIDPHLILSKRQNPLSVQLLVEDRHEFAMRYPDYVLQPVTLDEVILMIAKGDLNHERIA